MKKNKKIQNVVPATTNESLPFNNEELLTRVQEHFNDWEDDNLKRKTRPNGWDAVTDAYWGKLPEDWPFISRTTDPRIRTTLIEKNSRLTNRVLKGTVVPEKEGGDTLGGRIINSVIQSQWNQANFGGSMQDKISTVDMDTRLYASKYAYVYWRTEYDKNGKLLFDGNEMMPLNREDCGIDPNCDNIRNANWFQHRIWMQWQDLELNKDLYEGFSKLKELVAKGPLVAQKRRDSKFQSRVKTIKGLEDRLGLDKAFPVIQVVVEYRKDKFITFCPDYNLILSITDNPYEHGKLPIVQNKYYKVEGDPDGESEVETVLPLWRAIQAVMCAFLDEVIIKMRPPLKVVEGAARTETLVYAPEAHWLMDNVNAVTEMESRSDSIKYFQNTYPALVSAFNVAMGDMSQGVSNADPMQSDKTATEIRQISKQQNTRDQKNQVSLADFVKDVVSMWMSNNKQFLFRNPDKQEHIIQIIGDENFSYFKRAGLDEMIVPDEAMGTIEEIITGSQEAGQPLSQSDLESVIEAAKVPKYPVVTNPKETDVSKMNFKPKMSVSKMGDSAELSVVPEDVDGYWSFIPDMKSMESSATDQKIFARMNAIQQITNPNILMMLQAEGFKPRIKDLLVSNFEDSGLLDASKYFEAVPAAGNAQNPAIQGATPTGSVLPPQPNTGMAAAPQAPSQPSIDQQMAGSNQIFQ